MKVFVHPRGVVRAVLLPAIFGWLPTLWSLFRETSFLIVAFARGLNRFAVITSFAIGSSIFPAIAASPLATYISTVSGHLGKLTFTPEEACADATAYFNPGFVYAYTAPRAQSGFWSCYWTRTQDNQTVESGFAVAQGSLCADGTIPDVKKPLELQCGGQQFWATGVATGSIREQSCSVGNPVRTGTGIKIQHENDTISIQSDTDAILRTFRSAYSLEPSDGFGSRWMHQWQRRLNGLSLQSASPTLLALRGDGRTVKFSKSGGLWTATDRSRDHVEEVMSAAARTGWKYFDADTDSTEMYDASGRLMSVTARNGRTTTLSYSDARTLRSTAPNVGMLIAVRGWSGRTVSFVYDSARRISSITASDGSVTRYAYDASGMLTNVTWPDTRVRSYHYEDSRFPWALTGITDESGVRFATYAYDAEGRATHTEHAAGVDKFQLSFLGNGQTSVTTSDATSRTFTTELQGNVLRATGASAPCPACGDIAKALTYNAAGNVASRRDFADKETRYSYDALGRETQRIEGYGNADAKTTTTEWHPTWNLPLKIAAPSRVDYFTYDGMGQMTAHGWFPTADVNGGQGLNAAPSGAVSSNSYGYDTNGLMTALTEQVDGTATQQWTFGYDAQGNLTSAADGTGRTSHAVQYDAAGRLLEAVDLEGVTVKYVYDQRGRVLQYLYGENVTAYVYDAIGQKVQVTSPNGDVTNYTYDAAHRLIDVLFNGQSLTGPDPDEQPLALARTSAEDAGANPFSAWMGWVSKLFNWLFGSAHAQAIPVPVTAVGASMSIPGTYTPNPWDVLAPNLGGKKPWEWMAIWTTRLIEACSGNSPRTDHRGRIQAQGPGYPDEGVGDVEAWAQADPLSAASGLAKLEALEGRMTKKQYQARSQALARAKRFVVNASRGGGTGPTKQTFRNDEVIAVNGSERIDIEVQKGMAFVP
ncbi:DUF6531 domain-containing protein [Cupriavidus pauculus]|uniref:DUF6531 domain-containing protein n=1 Tax=Cupriavidus pauculus TaxID=82633 RepID=UPI0030F88CB8